VSGPLHALAAPVRAVLDEMLRRPYDAPWEAVAAAIAQRCGLDLREAQVTVGATYRHATDLLPSVRVELRDLSDPSGDVEVTIVHTPTRWQPAVGLMPGVFNRV
jgi:hypothetical protein